MQARGIGYVLLGGLALLVIAALASVSLVSGDRVPSVSSAWVVVPREIHFDAPADAGRGQQVVVQALDFTDAPGLTAALDQRLLAMAGFASAVGSDRAGGMPPSFAAFARRLFKDSAAARRADPEVPPYSARLSARVIDRHAGLTVVRLDTELYLGGAHDISETRYAVVDDAGRRVVSLADMLLPNKKPAFERVLAKAERSWRARQGLDASEWPFAPCDNAAPLIHDLVVTYPAYAVAPYAYGEPAIHIRYAVLRGILRPRFIPAARR